MSAAPAPGDERHSRRPGSDGSAARRGRGGAGGRDGRLLALVCAGALLAAAGLWGAGQAVWSGEGRDALTGAAAAPALGGIALLALAAVAGVVATAGIARRLVGLVVALAGVVAVVVALGTPLPSPTGASWFAVAAAVPLGVAGVLVLVREPRLPRLGARYAAPGARRPPADPDRAAWQALDEGRDPTA